MMGKLSKFILFFADDEDNNGNIFNEKQADWKEKYYIAETGTEKSNQNYKYSKNYFKILPDTKYAVSVNKTTGASVGLTIPFYDADKEFVERKAVIAATANTGIISGEFTTPSECAYFRLSVPISCKDVTVTKK